MPSPCFSPLFLFLAEEFGTPGKPNDRAAIRTIAHGLATGGLVYDHEVGDYVLVRGVLEVDELVPIADQAEAAEATP